MSAGDFDVVVLGAGPAGAGAAIALRQRGLTVGVLERAAFPRDKVCGCTLDPHAIATLERMRADSCLAGARALTHVRVAARGARTMLPLRRTLALSRRRLDAALVDRARADGARVECGIAAVHVTRSPAGFAVERSDAAVWNARAIVTATGLCDVVLGSPHAVDPRARIGVAATLALPYGGVPDGALAMHVGDAGYVGLVRLEDEHVRVAAAIDPHAVRGGDVAVVIERILAASGETLRIAPDTVFRATPPLSRTRTAVAANGVFAVGDACGYVEPFTGEGIGWALRSAELVAPFVDAWIQGDSRADRGYDVAWRRCIGGSRGAARRLRAWSRHPRLVAAALHAMQVAPALGRLWMPA